MLTDKDLEIIQQFRTESTALRTTPVSIKREINAGHDIYTKQPITTTVYETVNAIVRGYTDLVGGEKTIVNGIALQTGDAVVSFSYGVNLTGVKTMSHDGVTYVFVSIMPKGIGVPNRYECIARRAT